MRRDGAREPRARFGGLHRGTDLFEQFPVLTQGVHLEVAQDELKVAGPADRELVGSDLHEAMAGVEPLSAEVLRPDADPQPARAVLLEPGQRLCEQPRAEALR